MRKDMTEDISGHLIAARKLLTSLENLNANPDINGHENIWCALIDLDMVVQSMMLKYDIRVERPK